MTAPIHEHDLTPGTPSADASIRGAADPVDGAGHDRSAWREPAVMGAFALLVGAMAAAMYATHRAGHWWGDDWALYLRQARSLLDGDAARITADNEFTVQHSLGQPFSPPLYPWGFPLLLVPFVAVVGLDVDALTIVPVLCACAFACAWFAMARRRIGTVAAFVATAAVTLTPLLVSWSELIQSEWPFLAAVFVVLAAVDRTIASRVLTDTAARWWPLIALGVGVAAAFSIRREGLALVVAVGGAQLALLTTGSPPFRRMFRDLRLVTRLLVPHLSALLTVQILQWTLPSTLVPKYDGTSITNIWHFAPRLARNLAEVSGIKRPWDRSPVVLGSVPLGWATFYAYIALAVVGVVLAVGVNRRRDLHLVLYAVTAYAIGGSFRSAINRYVASVGPVLFLLGLVAIVSLTSLGGRRLAIGGKVVVTVVSLAFVAGNVANLHLRAESAAQAADVGAVEWGAQHPAAIELWEYVKSATDPTDIVAGPKARALTLMTDRRSIQVDQWRPLPDDWSPTLVVTEVGSPTDSSMRTRTSRYTVAWANDRFVVYRALTEPQHP